MPPVRLLLASGSPRRKQILTQLGADFTVVPSEIDDGQLTPPPGATALTWAVAMAYLKAFAAIEVLPENAAGVVMGADTSCELDGRIIGKPESEAQARATLRSMVGQTQRVVTGVALVDPHHPRSNRLLMADVALVTFGNVSEDAIDRYLLTGGWRGKAGGYNLTERQADGWPITVRGNPGTVVGLPTHCLPEWLALTVSWDASS